MPSVHNTITCSVCVKEMRADNLKRHMRIHSEAPIPESEAPSVAPIPEVTPEVLPGFYMKSKTGRWVKLIKQRNPDGSLKKRFAKQILPYSLEPAPPVGVL